MVARTSSALDRPPIARTLKPVATRPVVTIVCAGRSAAIDLRRVKATRFQNIVVVRLDVLWFDSKLGADMSTLRFDFVGEDGFRPTRVGQEPLPGDKLRVGFINARSRNLMWDDSSIDPVFAVQGVTMIVGHQAPL